MTIFAKSKTVTAKDPPQAMFKNKSRQTLWPRPFRGKGIQTRSTTSTCLLTSVCVCMHVGGVRKYLNTNMNDFALYDSYFMGYERRNISMIPFWSWVWSLWEAYILKHSMTHTESLFFVTNQHDLCKKKVFWTWTPKIPVIIQ